MYYDTVRINKTKKYVLSTSRPIHKLITVDYDNNKKKKQNNITKYIALPLPTG